jgi:hypothetical protein
MADVRRIERAPENPDTQGRCVCGGHNWSV